MDEQPDQSTIIHTFTKAENRVHSFNLIDAQILLGLSAMESGHAYSCAGLVANCAAISSAISTAEEFAAALNKFLYISAIVIDGESVSIAPLGRELINKARTKAKPDADIKELHELVYKELSAYKLKSMCNRNVWTQEQYQQAIAAHHIA